ncbi:MAG: imelysin family protein [Tenacibaculum sp.]
MIKKTKNLVAITLLLTFCIVTCSKNDTEANFDIKKLRADLINSTEKPIRQNLTESINNLNTAVNSFANTTNKENLQIVKEAWKEAAINFSLIEVFNFGEVKSTNIQTAFYSWGANEAAIANFIASTDITNEENINSLPTNNRGLSAIEFLLFEQTEELTLQSFSNKRRLDYLQELGKNLVAKSTAYNLLWGSYQIIFIENDKNGINGSINQVVNQMYALLEDIKSLKIGQPAAIEKTTTANAEILQAEKSSFSLQLIQKNIESIKRLYFGDTNGLDDYVFFKTKNSELNDQIEKTFVEIENKITDFKGIPLKESIFSQSADVQSLYRSIRNLLILVRVDLANVLSVTITVTDNDGD